MLKKIIQAYDRVEELIVAVLLFAAVLIAGYAVMMRYFFNRPPLWSEEIVCYLQVWLTFFGVSYAARDHSNFIRFDMVYNKLSPKGKTILDIVVAIICMVLVGVVGFRSTSWVEGLSRYGGKSIVLGIQNWIPRVIMPVSFLLLFLRYLDHLIHSIISFRKTKEVQD